MILRHEFVLRALEPSANISGLCKEYGISRDIAYKWIRRYKMEGISGLTDRSKRPTSMPSRIHNSIVELILAAKEEFPDWGAKKIIQVLANRGHKELPSIASTNRILQQYDKIDETEAKKRKGFIRFEKAFPNELWQMDFKGFFATDEGNCYPLTILDDCSRYSICLKACASENELSVRKALEDAFTENGLPLAMTMDNGSPWKGYPKQRLSSITVWLMRLGIRVSHSRPGHPQTQGKLERFHQSLKKEVLKYHNFQSLEDAQNNFNEWRNIYNYTRPHEGIGLQCPGMKYIKSDRKYSSKLPTIDYEPEDIVREVGKNGELSFKGKRCYIGGHLKGEPVAFRLREENKWDIYYFNTRIAGFSLKV